MTEPPSPGSTSPTSKAKAWSAWYSWLGMALAPTVLCLPGQGGSPGGENTQGTCSGQQSMSDLSCLGVNLDLMGRGPNLSHSDIKVHSLSLFLLCMLSLFG